MNVLMLLSDGFGALGGMSKFNRDFLQALDASATINRVHAVPRVIPDSINESLPESVVYDRRAARGKIAFVRRAAAHAWYDSRIELVVCGHVHLLPVAYFIARHRNACLSLIIHGVEAWKPTGSRLTNRLARSIDRLIAVSELSTEKFCEWSRLPAAKAFVLPNCVDLDRFIPQPRDTALVRRYGLASSRVIMTLGRLESRERYKGFDEVLEAMPALVARFPDLKYLIVGDGEDSERLHNKADQLGIHDRVVFAGRIPENEKVRHYNLADAYVMPSMGEGFGIVLIEAAACGIPVIGSNADGSREALLQGRLGRLIDPRDAQQLKDAIAETLAAGAPRVRNEAIETFGTKEFRARVDGWLHGQLGHCRPGRRSTKSPELDIGHGRLANLAGGPH